MDEKKQGYHWECKYCDCTRAVPYPDEPDFLVCARCGAEFNRDIEYLRDIIRKHMNDGWIPVEKALPRCEEEVFIQTERGTRTTAMYEDGTMREEDSIWHWCDIDGDWDEERDCMIIPKGWWEYRYFNPDDVYNNVVDEKVIAWRPLPDLYQLEIES